MASFISPTQLISTSKFTSTQSHTHQSPPSSVAFRRSQRISASYSSATAERPTTISHTVSPESSLYQVLGIDMVASIPEIKAAYRRLARVSHPDVAANNDSSADEFIKIHEAYSTLSDPGKRAEYDRSLFRRRMTSTTIRAATSSRYSGYTTGRSWETDQCW